MTLCLQSRCSSQLSYTPNIQETSFKHSTIKLITKTLFKLCYRGIEPLPSFYQNKVIEKEIAVCFLIQQCFEPMEGVEPTTPRLQITCSSQLSYIGK